MYERMEDLDKALSTYEQGMKVAKAAGDRHSFGELQGAKEMIQDWGFKIMDSIWPILWHDTSSASGTKFLPAYVVF